MSLFEIVQVRGEFPDGRPHLCWQGPNEKHDLLQVPFRCEQCATIYQTRDELNDSTFFVKSPRHKPMPEKFAALWATVTMMQRMEIVGSLTKILTKEQMASLLALIKEGF